METTAIDLHDAEGILDDLDQHGTGKGMGFSSLAAVCVKQPCELSCLIQHAVVWFS